jgi:hypothetical protein
MASYNINEVWNIYNSVKKSIYDALFNYFDTPPDAPLLVSLLEPRFKKK